MWKTTYACLVVVAMLAVLAPSARAQVETSPSERPRLRVADVSVAEGDDGVTVVVFEVTASRGAHATVDFTIKGGTAVDGIDYVASSGRLTFTPRASTRRVGIEVIGDRITEPTETFRIKLSNAVGATIRDRTGRATIEDDDAGPSISIGDATVVEGQSAAFVVTLSAPVDISVTVDYATADGSATAPADYAEMSGTLTFDPGRTVNQIVIPVAGDSTPEIRETYSLNLPNATGATIADGVGVGAITDDDTPSITVANASVTEGNSGTVNAVFNVTLSFQSSQVVTIDYATADGSATAPADYQATSGTLTLDPGETVGQIIVPVVGDTAIEAAESFSLNLTNPVNATFADPAAQGTIADNDTVSVSIGAVTVTETNSGTRDAVFTVTLSAVSGSTVMVDYATANGSATAPADYVAIAGTITFAPGEVSKQFVVQVVGDTIVEANETYSVNLSNPVNATIGGSGYGLGTITNND